jgi:hypothetical protein
MRSVVKRLLCGLVGVTAAGAPTPADAETLIRVEFEGVITNSAVFADPFGFGTGSGALNGRTIHGTFFYDADNAPPDSDVAARSVFHQTTEDSASWYSIPEVYIDDMPVPVPSFDLFENFLQTDSAYVGLKDEVFSGFDAVEYHRGLYQFFDGSNRHDFSFDLVVDSIATGANIIDSLLLTTPYTVPDFSLLSTFGSSVTSARVDDGVTAYEFFADFELAPPGLTVAESQECGNGNVEPPEECDPPGAFCDPDCTLTDSDGDGVPDDGDASGDPLDNLCPDGVTESCDDNCPNWPNMDQGDLSSDGIGDACQCGDVDGNGVLNTTDALLIARGRVTDPDDTARCDVSGDAEHACNTTDALLVARGRAPTTPQEQTCPAYTGE